MDGIANMTYIKAHIHDTATHIACTAAHIAYTAAHIAYTAAQFTQPLLRKISDTQPLSVYGGNVY